MDTLGTTVSAVNQQVLSRTLDRVLNDAQLTGILTLSFRNLRVFPHVATNYDLKDTQTVDLSNNRLTELSNSICEFVHIETLVAHHNCIRVISASFHNLRCLTYLDLSCNNLSTFPVSLCYLPLQVLLLSQNKLLQMPNTEVRRWSATLMELDISCNDISELPAEMGALKCLRVLNLRSNLLTSLPYEIFQLKLVSLDLAQNNLTTIHPDLRYMTSLIQLNLDGNPLSYPPVKVCLRGPVHVLKYLEKDELRKHRRKMTNSATFSFNSNQRSRSCVREASLRLKPTNENDLQLAVAERNNDRRRHGRHTIASAADPGSLAADEAVRLAAQIDNHQAQSSSILNCSEAITSASSENGHRQSTLAAKRVEFFAESFTAQTAHSSSLKRSQNSAPTIVNSLKRNTQQQKASEMLLSFCDTVPEINGSRDELDTATPTHNANGNSLKPTATPVDDDSTPKATPVKQESKYSFGTNGQEIRYSPRQSPNTKELQMVPNKNRPQLNGSSTGSMISSGWSSNDSSRSSSSIVDRFIAGNDRIRASSPDSSEHATRETKSSSPRQSYEYVSPFARLNKPKHCIMSSEPRVASSEFIKSLYGGGGGVGVSGMRSSTPQTSAASTSLEAVENVNIPVTVALRQPPSVAQHSDHHLLSRAAAYNAEASILLPCRRSDHQEASLDLTVTSFHLPVKKPCLILFNNNTSISDDTTDRPQYAACGDTNTNNQNSEQHSTVKQTAEVKKATLASGQTCSNHSSQKSTANQGLAKTQSAEASSTLNTGRVRRSFAGRTTSIATTTKVAQPVSTTVSNGSSRKPLPTNTRTSERQPRPVQSTPMSNGIVRNTMVNKAPKTTATVVNGKTPSASAALKIKSSNPSCDNLEWAARKINNFNLQSLKLILEAALNCSLPADESNVKEYLSDGICLCDFANKIRPGSVPNVNRPLSNATLPPIKSKRNLENFILACRRIGIDEATLCTVSDLQEGKHFDRMCATIDALSKLSQLTLSVDKNANTIVSSNSQPNFRVSQLPKSSMNKLNSVAVTNTTTVKNNYSSLNRTVMSQKKTSV